MQKLESVEVQYSPGAVLSEHGSTDAGRRAPQSVQSAPSEQLAHSAPGPPSSQVPSDAHPPAKPHVSWHSINGQLVAAIQQKPEHATSQRAYGGASGGAPGGGAGGIGGIGGDGGAAGGAGGGVDGGMDGGVAGGSGGGGEIVEYMTW